jgi:hypothetical protein
MSYFHCEKATLFMDSFENKVLTSTQLTEPYNIIKYFIWICRRLSCLKSPGVYCLRDRKIGAN